MLRDAYELYLDLVTDPRAVSAPKSKHTPFLGLDPLHDKVSRESLIQPSFNPVGAPSTTK